MTRSERMKPVARVAESRQQQAARRLGERQRALDEQRRRLAELETYRDEYAARFERGETGMQGLQVREYRLFLDRLATAVEQQRRNVESAQAALEQSRGEWTRTRVHQDAVDKVMGRFRAEEDHEQARLEQAENDDFGQRSRQRDP